MTSPSRARGPTKNAATTKTGHARRVPLLPEALFALRMLRALEDFTTEADDLVFPSPTGRQRGRDNDHGWSSRKVSSYPRKGHRELAGVRREVAFYGMRHGCATALVQGDVTAAPVPMAHVQRFLGHTSIAMTQRYTHLAPEYLHAVVRPVDDTHAGIIQGSHDPRLIPRQKADHAGKQAPPKGLEPLTGGLEIRCSSQLSYEGETYRGSGRRDSNPRQRAPKARALPGCATPRVSSTTRLLARRSAQRQPVR